MSKSIREGMELKNGKGHRHRLGKRIGAGGEGIVHSVLFNETDVIKIYNDLPDPRREEKISAAVALTLPGLAENVAWPREQITAGGEFVGFLTSRIYGHPLFELYGPDSRRWLFPRADWRHLVRAARNLACMFRKLHAAGVVVGDVNENLALVGEDMVVGIIDCDSMQFDGGSGLYHCDVGTPAYLPPELVGADLRGRERLPEQDLFGLAVLIFRLLFLGRHPFAGVYYGSGEPTTPDNIAARRFAYAPDGLRRRQRPPPGTLPLTAVGSLGDLFVNAFIMSAGDRPSAAAWERALRELERTYRVCPRFAAHVYAGGDACPWCTMAGEIGEDPFPVAP